MTILALLLTAVAQAPAEPSGPPRKQQVHEMGRDAHLCAYPVVAVDNSIAVDEKGIYV